MENESVKESIEVDEFLQTIHQSPDKVVLIDLMNPVDFANRHIPGALNIPLEEFEKRVSEIPKDKMVVVACNRGLMKSDMALQQLRNLGYTDAKKLEGGTTAWYNYNSNVDS